MAGPTVGTFSKGLRVSRNQARFAGKINSWVSQTDERMNYVHREATWKLIKEMQNTVPYKDGYLKASLSTSLNLAPLPADVEAIGNPGTWNEQVAYDLVHDSTYEDRIVSNYTMVYARRLEYGFTGTDSLGRSYNQPPRGWVRKAAQKWKRFVALSVQEAKGKIK